MLGRESVNAVLEDWRTAPDLSEGLRATLGFLEKLTLDPAGLSPAHAREVLNAGVTPAQLEDAIAVASLFNIYDRCADTFDFAIPAPEGFEAAADRLLSRGYA